MKIVEAVKILKSGDLVAMPTETVYGLAADARNPLALAKIFKAKQRPEDHPLIVHIADISMMKDWARDISPQALLLAKTFWPGPLTLILKKAASVSDLVTGGQDTIGLRIPNHPVTRELLHVFGGGLAAPSANRFGRISPTTAEAVKAELGDAVDLILDGGQCAVGVESTIVDVSGDDIAVLRPGMISVQEIENVIQQSVLLRKKNSPRVSGSHEKHYSPVTLTRLVKMDDVLRDVVGPVAIVGFADDGVNVELPSRKVVMSRDVREYAHELYKVLRELDGGGFREILIEEVPEGSEWDAVRDRIGRACVK